MDKLENNIQPAYTFWIVPVNLSTTMNFSIPEHIKAELRSLDVRRECPICLDIITKGNVEITDCGHYFCSSCLSAYNVCPTCRAVHRRVGRLQKKKHTTNTIDEFFDKGRYEAIGNEVYYVLPNGDCYTLDPHTFTMPHTFVGRISKNRDFFY